MNNAYGKSIMKPIETEVKIFTNETRWSLLVKGSKEKILILFAQLKI